jgi:hypothetical protein
VRPHMIRHALNVPVQFGFAASSPAAQSNSR